MQIEINASKRDTQGTESEPPPASRRPGSRYRIWQWRRRPVDRPESQGPCTFGLKNEAFHSSVLNLNLDGVKEAVLLRDFQMHPYKPLVLHIDFQRVDAKPEDPHEGAAALRQRRSRSWCEAGWRCRQPPPDRGRGALPAGRAAGVHRSRSFQAGSRVRPSICPIWPLPEGVEFASPVTRGEDHGVANILAIRGGAAAEETAAA
jgi:hypothetical protein